MHSDSYDRKTARLTDELQKRQAAVSADTCTLHGILYLSLFVESTFSY
jgi:hypothetical protein